MFVFESPYTVLGIEVGATLAQIKAAFRKLAKDCHPDRHPDDPKAAEKFCRIAAAYEAIVALRKRGGNGQARRGWHWQCPAGRTAAACRRFVGALGGHCASGRG